ncbi:hypothetical protein BH09VER1_BH09VER1_45600 [soil metagenome]
MNGRLMRMGLLIGWLAFSFGAQAKEDEYERILQQKDIRKEAALLGADVVYRYGSMPEISSDGKKPRAHSRLFSLEVSIKAPAGNPNGDLEGLLTLRILKADGAIFVRSRTLSQDEIGGIVGAVRREEVFSLP